MTTGVMPVEAGLGVAILPTYVWSFPRGRNVISKPLIEPKMHVNLMVHARGRSRFAPFLLSMPVARCRREGGPRQLWQEHK